MILTKGTLEEDYKRWLKAFYRQAKIDEKSENTISSYERVFNELELFLLAYYSDLSISEIDNDVILHFLEYYEEKRFLVSKKKFSTNTKILNGNILKSLFSFISRKNDKKHSFKNATDGITPKRVKKGGPEYLNSDEVEKLINYLNEKVSTSKSHSSYINSLGIKLMILAGLRITETLNLKVTDFTIQDSLNEEGERDCYLIHLGKTKTGVDMKATILMVDILEELEYFNDIYTKDDNRASIFTRNDGLSFIHRKNFYYTAKKIMTNASVFRKGLHIFRHSAAMRIYRATSDVLVVKSALNHQNIQTTMIYAEAEKEDVAKALRNVKESN